MNKCLWDNPCSHCTKDKVCTLTIPCAFKDIDSKITIK